MLLLGAGDGPAENEPLEDPPARRRLPVGRRGHAWAILGPGEGGARRSASPPPAPDRPSSSPNRCTDLGVATYITPSARARRPPSFPPRRPVRLNDGLGRRTGRTRPSPSRGLLGRTVRRRVRAPPSGSRQPDPKRGPPPSPATSSRRSRSGWPHESRCDDPGTSEGDLPRGRGRVQPIHRYPTPGSVRISRGAAASSPSLRRRERT
jgi:hypothetical protein